MTVHDDSAPDLDQWSRRLTQALQILDLKVDTQEILQLARQASGSVSPEAGALTTFYVGYAAALDAAGNRSSRTPDQAVRDAAATAARLADQGVNGGPDSVGWAATGQ
ncbi:hypothetical protein GCM10011374_33610 [Kocuria dechangensis]|uniref:DUF6457 domain-containing protein n=1 Tax=Kocuria dechangensis TaxID=1176249 RepID=A0A917H3U5_9MICC|nr:DUF6457 domain-containing protein [Kocuria dechangensis]GGG66733.1 hypothetical protein GCM10011374_33610 [Kocuria dechangensis]